MLKKKIEISIINLIAILLLIIGIALGIVALSNYGEGKCLQDPVGYVNENINQYFDGNVEIIVMPLDPGSVYDSGA